MGLGGAAVRRVMKDRGFPGSAIPHRVSEEDPLLWRPLSLAEIVHDATRSPAALNLLVAWLTLTVACVILGIYQVKFAWNALPIHIGFIRSSLTIYPPLV